MPEFTSLIIGIASGLLVLLIASAYKKYRLKSILSDIEILEYEKEHLTEMKRSSVEMNRSSFRAVFFVLAVICAANLVPIIISALIDGNLIHPSRLSQLLGWSMALGFSLKFWKRYDNLKNYKDSIDRINKQLETLKARQTS